MGRLSQAIIAALRSGSGVAPNAYVQFLRQAIDEVEAAEARESSLTPLIDELVVIASARNFSLHSAAVNDFAQKLGEAHFVALCAAKGISLEKIPETTIKTPDFKWVTDRDPIHFEVKTLSVVDGDRGIDAALENAFESQADLGVSERRARRLRPRRQKLRRMQQRDTRLRAWLPSSTRCWRSCVAT